VGLSGAAAEVFVIGGGPAGLAAAIAARRRGFRVTVADGADPVIDKACGEGLMPATQEALTRLGVELPADLGYAFRGIRLVEKSEAVSADFPSGRGIGIRRTQLHECLRSEAEKSGVRLLWKTPVMGIEAGGVRLTNGLVPARWIVGADGGHSRVRRWSELDTAVTHRQRFATRRHYSVRPWSEFMEIYWGNRVQGYMTPIGPEEVCVVMMGESVEDVKFERALTELPRLHKQLAGGELSSRERGAITVMHSLARVWRGNVALVGDASGGVDAITGEGLRLAFRQSAALAEALERGDLRGYQSEHCRMARRPMWMGTMLKQLGRYDTLRERTLKMLSRNPGLFERLLAVHVGRATRREVLTAGAALGWQLLASQRSRE
jgi:flavin-dependent dehydrogenase